jgi:predicted metalloprotease with PDZ domain
LILFPFPQTAAVTQWSAETKGATVTLLMGKLPSKVGALAQLSTPLTHELLHLWVPNGLALEGDYDWFYEGFTVYQASSIAVRLDLLTFAEFLNAIAHAADASSSQINSVSLIEASRKRWTSGQSAVYSKSMLVAFLYDLRVRSSSHGKKSLDDIYRAIFQKHSRGTHANADGNQEATRALALDAAFELFVREFIENPVTINLANELAPFGLQVEAVGLRTRITVSQKLSKQQRDLLRKLGYNDAVRSPRR